jgi:tRNA-splicing ligase RtcB (3'-phosphate/5'-hydroxy nucleic acid ligase)
MDPSKFERINATCWRVEPQGEMRVPAVLFANEALLRGMDDKVYEQMTNVATLPGIVEASYAMPDAHWGYGFPIGGVAAFDPDDGIISAGGVGFDISCGVRMLTTGIPASEFESCKAALADALFAAIPAGVGSEGSIELASADMTAMLCGGAQWAVAQGYGEPADLQRIEELGCMAGSDPAAVSAQAKRRQLREIGTLGSGNHYLEVQQVAEIYAAQTAAALGLKTGDVVISIHSGSRGLGHQIGTEFLREMAEAAPEFGIHLPDRELACAPIKSALGQRYIGAMRAAINCALANRQILGHLTREVLARFFPHANFPLLYDVSHNTCKLERHLVDGVERELYVHRKGATRAFGPSSADLPPELAVTGQPVFIGGSMGTASYVLVGVAQDSHAAFASACHGAGRAMSRHAATRRWRGRELVDELASRGIIVKCPSMRGIAEEAPQAYKDVDAVVACAEQAGLANKVARLTPIISIKG